jgi:hypothetical protein
MFTTCSGKNSSKSWPRADGGDAKGDLMDKDVAIRIDAMAISVRTSLDGMARYMKDNLPPEVYACLVKSVGHSMADLVDPSTQLYASFPDIVPKELILPQSKGR